MREFEGNNDKEQSGEIVHRENYFLTQQRTIPHVLSNAVPASLSLTTEKCGGWSISSI